jgi:hypothetical protein
MDKFIRCFPVDDLVTSATSGGIDALFARWVLPGEDAGPHGLRLAIRNGYLNFYVKGQSVGELRMINRQPRLKIHTKYANNIMKGSKPDIPVGQTYETLDADQLAAIGPGVVDGWISTAETYAGDEKRFVDDLVAVTPGVLDLEMGLPADASAQGEDRVAPRMDLVVAQRTQIAFWEAKCATNGELRAVASYEEDAAGRYVRGPHVVKQLRRYQRWMEGTRRQRQVSDAYVDTARLLLELAERFAKNGPAIEAWRALKEAGDNAKVVPAPGVVVAGYCPPRADGKPREKETQAGKDRLASFSRHEDELARRGVRVIVVPDKPRAPCLPQLDIATVITAEPHP